MGMLNRPCPLHSQEPPPSERETRFGTGVRLGPARDLRVNFWRSFTRHFLRLQHRGSGKGNQKCCLT